MTQVLPPRSVGRSPNILLITSDEERYRLPQPAGFVLPARERLQARGVTFDNYYVASAQCSSSRSVIYTGQHVPITEIYDNDNMPYIRPLDPPLGTLGSMLRTAGYYCAYQGKWHLSNAYRTPTNPRPTTDALEPYGFSEFNDWGDIDGGAWAGLKRGSRDCRPGSEVAAGTARRWSPGAAVVHGSELRQPARHHELRLRRVAGPFTPAAEPGRSGEGQAAGRRAALFQALGLEVPASRRRRPVRCGAGGPRVRRARGGQMFGPVTDEEYLAARPEFLSQLHARRRPQHRRGARCARRLRPGRQHRRDLYFRSWRNGRFARAPAERKPRLRRELPRPDGHLSPRSRRWRPNRRAGFGDRSGARPCSTSPDWTRPPWPNGSRACMATPCCPRSTGQGVRDGVLTAVEIVTTLDNGFWRSLGTPDGPEKVQAGSLRPGLDQTRVPARIHRPSVHLRPLLLAPRTQPAPHDRPTAGR